MSLGGGGSWEEPDAKPGSALGVVLLVMVVEMVVVLVVVVAVSLKLVWLLVGLDVDRWLLVQALVVVLSELLSVAVFGPHQQ